MRNAQIVGITILLICLCSNIVIELFKNIFGRVRFRSMQDNFDLFTNWYQVNGSMYLEQVVKKEEIKSFPSGHAQVAGATLAFSLLTYINPCWRSKELVIFLLTFIYALLVLYSRIVQGAHCLTDVTIGFAVSFVFYIIFRQFLVLKKIDFLGVKK